LPFVPKYEKEILNSLILYAGLFLLTEREALEYIKEKLGKKISRRRYYYYRKKLGLQFLDAYTIFRCLQKEYSFDNKHNYEYLPDPLYMTRILGKSNKIINNSIFNPTELLRNFDLDFQISKKNLKILPINSIIREEYVICGKKYCNIKHGPYLYGYWRDSKNKNRKKLNKKYIGKIDPREKNNIEFNKVINDLLSTLKEMNIVDNYINQA
jgi:hypothetical protein